MRSARSRGLVAGVFGVALLVVGCGSGSSEESDLVDGGDAVESSTTDAPASPTTAPNGPATAAPATTSPATTHTTSVDVSTAPDETQPEATGAATPSDLPLPGVAEGQLLFAGAYGPNDCTEIRLGATRESTRGVTCPGATLPYWFTDAGELIVDVAAITDDMRIYFAQDLLFGAASSAVVIEWTPTDGISRQYLAIENLDDLVRVEPPYFIAIVDVCRWDVVHDRNAEGATLIIDYGQSQSVVYRLNVLVNERFPSLAAEGSDAPIALQEYMAGRGKDCGP